jgi:hypothetical protein
MNGRLGFVSGIGILAAVLALALVGALTLALGPVLFSSGPLSAKANGQTFGGIANHAQLERRCEACHTPFWSSETMADKCIGCHGDVGSQIQARTGLHGRMMTSMSSPTCRGCHVEHNGANGVLTTTDVKGFPHDLTGFPLRGRHAGLACARCHASGSFQASGPTPRDCYACHAKDDKHQGSFGRQCGSCHNANGWGNATFDHSVFPVNHGNGGLASSCATCHPNGTSSYACYGCHAHTPAGIQGSHRNIAASRLANCVSCHKGGRGD